MFFEWLVRKYYAKTLKKNEDRRDKTQSRILELTDELEAHEKRLTSIIETQQEMVCRFTKDGVLTFVNQAYCRVFGKSEEELLGNEFSESIHEDDKDNVLIEISLLDINNQKIILENRVVVNCDVRWQEWSDTAIFNNDGEILEYQSVGRDITDRKMLERKLNQQNRLFNGILESTTDFICRFNLRNEITYANQAYIKEFFKEDEEPLGTDFLHHHIHSDDYGLVQEKITETIQSIHRSESIWKARHVSGEYKCYHIQCVGIFGDNGNSDKIIEVQMVGRDITEQKKAEDKIACLLDQYDTLLNNIDTFVWYMEDPDTMGIVNQAFVDFFGYKDKDSLKNVKLKDLMDPEELELAIFNNKRIFEEGIDIKTEEWVINCNGEKRLWDIIKRPKIEDGKVKYIVASATDITDRKKAEDDLKENQIFLDSLIDSLPIPVFYKDIDGRYQIFNHSFEDFIGRGIDPKNKSVFEVVLEEFAEIYQDKDQELFETPGTQRYQTSFQNEYSDGKRDVVFHKATVLDINGKAKGLVGAVLDITDRKNAEDALQISENRYSDLFDNMSNAVAVFEPVDDGNDFLFIDFNKSGEKIDNIKKEDILGKSILEVYPGSKDMGIFDVLKQVYKTGDSIDQPISFYKDDRTSGWRNNFVYKLSSGELVSVYSDETERVQTECYRNLSVDILTILNNSINFRESVKEVLSIIKDKTCCDAIGIRLKDEEDFPYFMHNGFTDDFLLTENTLIEHDIDNSICRNSDGSVSLECTCGQVISGSIVSDSSSTTSFGSFWTNKSDDFLKLHPDEDTRNNPRNRCIHDGYSSVALIPVRIKNDIVGILQLNGYSQDLFTLAIIHSLERIASDIGETLLRKRTEEMLKESESKFRLLAENSVDVIWKTNIELDTIYISPSIFNLTGYTSEEFINLSLKQRHDAETIKTINRKLKFILSKTIDEQKSIVLSFNGKIRHKDGKLIFMRINCKPIFEDGLFFGIQGITNDISEEQKYKHLLIYKNNLLDSVLEKQLDYIVRYDLDHKILYANQVYCDLIYDGNICVGESLKFDLFHPDDRDNYNKYLQDLLEEPHKAETDVRIKTKDNIYRYYNICGQGILDENKKLKEIQSVGRDVTKKHQLEKELDHKNQLLKGILEIQTDCIARSDLERNVIYANAAYSRIFCGSDDLSSCIQQDFIEQVYPEDIDIVKDAMKKLIENKPHKTSAEYRVVDYNGNTRFFRWQAIGILDEDGKVIEVQVVGQDIVDLIKTIGENNV